MVYDFAIVGAGAAGLSVAYAAARLGLRVGLIERGAMGGECLNTGCVPSKALLAAAHAAQAMEEAARLGIRAGAPSISWEGVRAHVRRAIDAAAPADSAERYRGLGADVIAGTARFVAPDTLEAAGRRIKARRIVLAVGARPAAPPIPGLDRVPYLTNETIFALKEPPEHLLIVGGGPIGLEMADAFAGLGAQVTIIEAARVAGKEDAELAAQLRDLLRAKGVAIEEGAAIAAAEPGPALVLADGRRFAGTHLLVATGKRPELEALDLAAGSVRATAQGIATDAGLRSLSNRRVYAVGDVADPEGVGPRAFTHVGTYHAGIIVRRAVFHLPARIDYRALPRVTYTDPELAQAGMTEAEARQAGHAVRVLRWTIAETDRARAEGDPRGEVKLVTARGRVLGAGILAPRAGEMIGIWTLAIARRLPLRALADMIVPYPTLSEAGRRAAGTAYLGALFAPRARWLAALLARLP
ncbi:MAG TPA: FAD-dependent oxidoreductase [Acetobacteraceae bacterium]|nr:FAD-dependent oxidoreductase [Acetobacteraceae bacterium]